MPRRNIVLPVAAVILGLPASALGGSWSSTTAGSMSVSLYTPDTESPVGDGRALLIALHGCSQKGTDLKKYGSWTGTAESEGVVIALPEVPGGGVYMGCWSYYGSSHSRSSGHAGKLLDLVEDLLADPDLDIDPDQVYIAGLSSGGGMAMVMGCLAPDVFAGVGIAAGPTLGTTASQIGSVSTSLSTASAACERLAGANADDFATQVTSVIAGTRDYTVAQGYATLNAQVFGAVYEDEGASLDSESFDVSALPGTSPAGTGTVWYDGDVARVSLISATGMGHAWPAGNGTGSEVLYVAPKGVDYAAYLAAFFQENNGRVSRDEVEEEPPVVEEEPPVVEEEPPVVEEEPPVVEEEPPVVEEEPPVVEEEPPVVEEEPASDPWVAVSSATLMGHLSHYASYSHGYGTADLTFTALMSAYGMSTSFTLYQGPSGAWYLSPAALSAAEGG